MSGPIMDIFAKAARAFSVRKVFPLYIASRIKRALVLPATGVLQPDEDFPGASVGEIETIGDCRYAIKLADRYGTQYRVTIEVTNEGGP